MRVSFGHLTKEVNKGSLGEFCTFISVSFQTVHTPQRQRCWTYEMHLVRNKKKSHDRSPSDQSNVQNSVAECWRVGGHGHI